MLRHIHSAKGHFSRSQGIYGTLNTVGNTAGDKLLILIKLSLRLGSIARWTKCAACRMRMGGRDQHIFRPNAGLDQYLTTCFNTQASVKAQQIAHHQGNLCAAIVQNNTAGFQLVVNILTGKG